MRGSIVCIAIFCLSCASGAPTDEEGKSFSKNYKFDKGEVINSYTPFFKDQAVFAVCEGSDADKKCKVYVESPNAVQSCDLNLSYSGQYADSVALTNAGDSKAIFVVRVGDDKLKFISVNLKGCQIKENTVEFVKGNTPDTPDSHITYNPLSAVLYILPHEKNYEVFIRNSKDCGQVLCKITHDYEGNVIEAASELPTVFQGAEDIDYVNNNYIIAKTENSFLSVYVVKDEEVLKDVPSAISVESRTFFTALSAGEDKIAVCAHAIGKVLCKQIHVDGEPKTVNIEIPFKFQKTSFHYLDVLNLEKGLLQLVVGVKNVINVTHFDEAGKQVKSVQVDPKCDEEYGLLTKLYENIDGQYCVNSFCMSTFDARDRSKFSIGNRCFLKTELF